MPNHGIAGTTNPRIPRNPCGEIRGGQARAGAIYIYCNIYICTHVEQQQEGGGKRHGGEIGVNAVVEGLGLVCDMDGKDYGESVHFESLNFEHFSGGS